MGMNIGSTSIDGVYLGSTEVQSAYIGGTKVYEKAAPAPSSVTIDGKTYPCALMPDGKVWTTVNLDLVFTGLSVPTANAQTYNNTTPQAMYYSYDETEYGWNGKKCGLLYNFPAVEELETNKSTLFPGWHVPSRTEWEALVTAASVRWNGAAIKALDNSVGGTWPSSWNGTDTYGFAALPAGYWFGTDYAGIGTQVIFWSSTVDGTYAYKFGWNQTGGVQNNSDPKTQQFSVRLVMD